jgi:hypothetical protein
VIRTEVPIPAIRDVSIIPNVGIGEAINTGFLLLKIPKNIISSKLMYIISVR